MKKHTPARTAVSVAAVAALAFGGAAAAQATPRSLVSLSSDGDRDKDKKRHAHDRVTGSELAAVTDAVTAKDPNFVVKKVFKDADGTYCAFGTSNGTYVRYDVSADLSTVTLVHTKKDHDGKKRHAHDRVTGEELTAVTDAVTAKDPNFVVKKVFKDADGTYCAFGTASGTYVRYDVSADLSTVTLVHTKEKHDDDKGLSLSSGADVGALLVRLGGAVDDMVGNLLDRS